MLLAGQVNWKRRVLPYSRAVIKEPSRLEHLEEWIEVAPCIHHMAETTSHNHTVEQCILEGLIKCFTVVQPEPKQQYITPATMAIVLHTGKILDKRTKAGISIGRAAAYSAFSFGAGQGWKRRCNTISSFASLTDIFQSQYWRIVYSKTHTQARGWLQLEQLAYVSTRADSAEQALISGNLQSLHHAVSKIKPWRPHKKAPPKKLRRIDGDQQPCITFHEERVTVKKHVAMELDGVDTSFENLVRVERESFAGKTFKLVNVERVDDAYPFVHQLMRLMVSARSGRAVG